MISMKKLCFMSIMLSVLASCHNGDWHFDDYGTRSVYFAYQYPVRTITLGEDPSTDNSLDLQHKCKIMATTGGGYTNSHDITIGYEIDESICQYKDEFGQLQYYKFKGTDTDILPMKKEYYTLSSDKIIIPAGKISGGIEVQLTDEFFADQNSVKNTYVIPIRMTDVVGADTILRGKPLMESPNLLVASDWDIAPKNYILYCIKYINPWHATYLRRGKDVIVGKTGNTSLTGEIVRHNKYVEEDEVMSMTTKSMTEVTYQLALKDATGTNRNYNIILTFDDDNNCTVKTDTEGCTVSGSGKFVSKGDKNSWGNEDRDVIYLEYDVDIDNLATCHTTDTLVVRNRGVVMELFTPEKK